MIKFLDISSLPELKSGLEENPDAFLLLFKKGSEQSDCAFERLRSIHSDMDIFVYTADVNKVRDIHPVYNIKSAPSFLEFKGGMLRNIYKGCQTENFYISAVSGEGFTTFRQPDGKRPKRVTVYTTPTCTWCNTIKTYLNENGIQYTEVNVAANPSKAEEMVSKSGQQGVPQTDIDGQIVVGFDKKRINELLEIN